MADAAAVLEPPSSIARELLERLYLWIRRAGAIHYIGAAVIAGAVAGAIFIPKEYGGPVKATSGPTGHVWISPNGSDSGTNCRRLSPAGKNPDVTGTTLCKGWNKAYLLSVGGDTIRPMCGTYVAQQINYDSMKSTTPPTFATDTSCMTTVGHPCAAPCSSPNFVATDGIVTYGVSHIVFTGTPSTFQAGELIVHNDFGSSGNDCCSFPAGVHWPTDVTYDGVYANFAGCGSCSTTTIKNSVIGNKFKLDPPNPLCPAQGQPANGACPNAGINGYSCPAGGTTGNGSGTQAPYETSGNIARFTTKISSSANAAPIGDADTFLLDRIENQPRPSPQLDPITGCPVVGHTAGLYVDGITNLKVQSSRFRNILIYFEDNPTTACASYCSTGMLIENSWFAAGSSEAIFIRPDPPRVMQDIVIRYNSLAGGLCCISAGNASTPASAGWSNDAFYGNAVKGTTTCPYQTNLGSGTVVMTGWTWSYSYQAATCPTATNMVISSADPFVDSSAAGFDLHSIAGSGLLGVGNPAAFPPTDIDGDARSSPPDIGADER